MLTDRLYKVRTGMSTKFPPSSPTRWDQSSEIGHKNGVSNQLNALSDDYMVAANSKHYKFKHYPTPNPSSSNGTGIPSSPVLSALHNEEDTQGQFSFDSSFTKDIIFDPSTTIAATTPNAQDDTIPISINPNLSQHLILGRKTSVCDIQLPSLKNISRQHAIVTYNDHTNLINISCLGTNGMVILFHSDIDFSLKKLSSRDNLTSYKIIPCPSPQRHPGRILQRQNDIISFALLKNESIELPLIHQTILDFRQCRSVIHVTIPASQDMDNDTETEDEMTLLSTKSDDFIHTPTKRLIPISTYSGSSPITEQVSIINQRSSPMKVTTPIITSVNQEEPHTPKKLKQNSFVNNNIRLNNNSESPIIRDSNSEFQFKPLTFKPLKQGVLKNTLSKLETELFSKSVNIPKTPRSDCQKFNPTTPPTETLQQSSKKESFKIKKEYITPTKKETTKSFKIHNENDTNMAKKTNDLIPETEVKIKLEQNIKSEIIQEKLLKPVSPSVVKEEIKDSNENIIAPQPLTHKRKNKRHATKINQNTPIDKVKQTPALKKKKRTVPIEYNEKDVLHGLAKRKIDPTEIQRVIINNLAYSNLKQTPLSQLRNITSQTKALTKIELKSIIHDAPCIGEIKRQGKDAAGKLLEEEFYYDIENDHDDERRSLIISLRGGRNSGLRSCRKTHKQYYWKKPAKK